MSDQPSLPRIGIPCQHNNEANRPYRVPLISQNRSYVRCVVDAGGVPILIPPIMPNEMVRALYSCLDGVLLAGGVDVDPALYREPPHHKLGSVDPDRDRIEIQLVEWALADGLPLFGICRGIQIMNVAAGGALYQDIASQMDTPITHTLVRGPRDAMAHSVQIVTGSRLASIIDRPAIEVNSLHHQAIKTVADPFRVTAQAPDGVIEAIEGRNGGFCLAVQWHPEELTDQVPAMANLFRSFIASAHRAPVRGK
jgi:putative glutamine amidotransferase